MSEPNLLALARKQKTKDRKSRAPNRQKAILALAWARGEVSYTQVQATVGGSTGASVYGMLACGLRDAFKLGLAGEL